jgi:hypothetical protein
MLDIGARLLLSLFISQPSCPLLVKTHPTSSGNKPSKEDKNTNIGKKNNERRRNLLGFETLSNMGVVVQCIEHT